MCMTLILHDDVHDDDDYIVRDGGDNINTG